MAYNDALDDHKTPIYMTGEVIAAYIAASAAIIIAGFNLFQLYITRKDQKTAEKNRNLFDALKWFEGRTQKRSIGIAVIEAYWKDNIEELKKVWKPLLVNQAIHILKRSEDKNNATEYNNLERIINLIKEADLEFDQKETIYDALLNANYRKEDNSYAENSKTGIYIENKKRVEWMNFFKKNNK